MPDLHQFPIYSLVDEGGAAELQALLKAEGWAIKHLSTAGARDDKSFLLSVSECLRVPAPPNWSVLADLLPAHVLSAAGPAPKVALIWWGAGEVASASLSTFVSAFDLFVGMGRRAYEDDIDVALFMLGSGAGFSPIGELLAEVAAEL